MQIIRDRENWMFENFFFVAKKNLPTIKNSRDIRGVFHEIFFRAASKKNGKSKQSAFSSMT